LKGAKKMETNTTVTDNTNAQFADKMQDAGMKLIKVASEILRDRFDVHDVDSVTIDLDTMAVSFGKRVNV
jgi:hypothetical protein